MTIIHQPENQRLTFYLTQEEYLSEHCCSDGYFFVWQTAPTVIYGKHQVLENEVNIDYCKANGVDVVQRQSGGGCVYSDEGNLMLSMISPCRHSQPVYAAFLQTLVMALERLGLSAVTTSHNDVLVAGRKVSGSACRLTPWGTIVHSTLLLSSNIEALEQAITPSTYKLAKNGVSSVRQRVITLAELGVNDKDTIIRTITETFENLHFEYE